MLWVVSPEEREEGRERDQRIENAGGYRDNIERKNERVREREANLWLVLVRPREKQDEKANRS